MPEIDFKTYNSPMFLKVEGTSYMMGKNFRTGKWRLAAQTAEVLYNRTLKRFVYDYMEMLPDDYDFETPEELIATANELEKAKVWYP